ncbi:hypothetical protein V1291_001726 [Nitrobacteraceae bacterium AZCC 1564]
MNLTWSHYVAGCESFRLLAKRYVDGLFRQNLLTRKDFFNWCIKCTIPKQIKQLFSKELTGKLRPDFG